jgi:hypothetical protein
MSNWSVQITGDKFDLEELPGWFNTPELMMVKESDGIYIHSSHFDSSKDSNEVRSLAEELIEKINGVSKLYRSDFQPLKIGAVVREKEDGSKDIHLSVSDSVIITCKTRVKLSGNGDEHEPSVPKPITWLNVAQKFEEVSHALRIWEKGPLDWINLYKIFEIVESDVGGKIYQQEWITKADANRFSQTANSAEALGDEARHAKQHVPAPPIPMTLQEAQHNIKELLIKWIESKSP